MRRLVAAFAVACAVLVLAEPTSAQSSASVGGFGGVSISTGADAVRPDLGATLSVAVTPHVQIVGEGGRFGNVLSPLADTVYSFTGVGLHASAIYAKGGVRLVAAPESAISPYVEATAGVARLSLGATGLGSIGNAALPIAVSFLPRTGPIAGVGGGLVARAGALQVDLGYRFTQFYPPDALRLALGLGQDLRSQQVRVGFGIRF